MRYLYVSNKFAFILCFVKQIKIIATLLYIHSI